MKSLYILGIVALLCTAFFLSQNTVKPNNKFAAWKAEYGFSFTEEEDQYRQQVFAENVKAIENHNDPSYTVAINQFTGLTQEEFQQTYLSLIPAERTGKTHIDYNINVDDIDWVAKGAVSPIKDQGQCGSCWAFSAVGNLEGVNEIATKSMKTFSEQQLVDCSRAQGNQGCNGGWMDQAFQYVKAKGITTEDQYPYKAVDQKCKIDGGDFKINKIIDVPKANCDSLLNALMIEPISVAVDATNWSSYSSGIFSNCRKNLNHGVLLVGYKSGSNYVVKNSWGTRWGEKGYIRLALQDTCGICDAASYTQI